MTGIVNLGGSTGSINVDESEANMLRAKSLACHMHIQVVEPRIKLLQDIQNKRNVHFQRRVAKANK